MENLPVALTIAGSDSGGAAGIQADLLTFAAAGVYGTTVITCLTAQNPGGVSAIEVLPAAFVREQITQVVSFYRPRAAKTGMLFSRDIIETVAGFFDEHPNILSVVDPVMVASSGAVLLKPEAVTAMKEDLIPRAVLVTPNLDETGVLLGRRPESESDLIDAGRELVRQFGTSFLVKGGHLEGDPILDALFQPGKEPVLYRSGRIGAIDTHGSGCTLSAAIAARLAAGLELQAAVAGAHSYLRAGMERPLYLDDHPFIRHLP